MFSELLNLCPSLKNKTILLREKFIVLAHGFKVELADNLHRIQLFASSCVLALLGEVRLVTEGS